jgi:hypothetical protein
VRYIKKYNTKSFYIIFIDIISIASDMEEEHRKYIRAILDMSCKKNLKLKDKKYNFGQI